jgi:hypothetical protein
MTLQNQKADQQDWEIPGSLQNAHQKYGDIPGSLQNADQNYPVSTG